MNTMAIYERLPISAQQAIVSYYGRKLHRMRFGGFHDDERERIRAGDRMDAASMRAVQVERMRAILAEAVAHVPYWREAERLEPLAKLARSLRDPSEIEILPPLEKKTINADPARFHSSSPGGKPIYGNTSGTTGRPLRTMKTAESYQRNWAHYQATKELHGVRMGMRRATFGTRMVVPTRQRKLPFWRFEPAENNVYFSLFHLSEEFLPSYVEKLLEWKPEEVVCFPSALTVLAEHMVRRGVQLTGVHAVFALSETLFDWQRERIATAMGAKVVNVYGLAENVAWIFECPEGRHHVRPDYGYTELLPSRTDLGATPYDDEGEVREIVSTGFLNRAMPLLRYRTRDQAIVGPRDAEPCACGLRFPTVTRVIGRLDDNLVTPDGRVQTRLDGIFKGIGGVRESQLEQTALDRLIVRVVPSEGYGPAWEEEVRTRIRRIFTDRMQVEVQLVPELPRTRAGKVRYQVNSIPAGLRNVAAIGATPPGGASAEAPR
ncbi:MAG: phenylacetate--CoA ligase family protein [Candidatus Eisenbacteria bacterium]